MGLGRRTSCLVCFFRIASKFFLSLKSQTPNSWNVQLTGSLWRVCLLAPAGGRSSSGLCSKECGAAVGCTYQKRECEAGKRLLCWEQVSVLATSTKLLLRFLELPLIASFVYWIFSSEITSWEEKDISWSLRDTMRASRKIQALQDCRISCSSKYLQIDILLLDINFSIREVVCVHCVDLAAFQSRL